MQRLNNNSNRLLRNHIDFVSYIFLCYADKKFFLKNSD